MGSLPGRQILSVMRNLNFLFIFCFSFIPCIAQKGNTNAPKKILSEEAKSHWDRAIIYIEEAKTFSDYSFAINELEALLKIEEYPDAYLELGKIYGKGYTDIEINRSEECFNKYMELCPRTKNIAEEEMNKCEVRRNIRKKKFEDKLIGKWSSTGDFGSYFYCFEVNNNGSVTVPYEYSYEMEMVSDWQTIGFTYWPTFGKYTLTTNQTFADTFKVKYYNQDIGAWQNKYVYISFFYQENSEHSADGELICYINCAFPKETNGYYNGDYFWIWNENHKIVFKKTK